jgi:hypothetical protein
MVLPDHKVTPTTTRVAESLDIPTGSPVVVLESREPKAPKVWRQRRKELSRVPELYKVERIRLRPGRLSRIDMLPVGLASFQCDWNITSKILPVRLKCY